MHGRTLRYTKKRELIGIEMPQNIAKQVQNEGRLEICGERYCIAVFPQETREVIQRVSGRTMWLGENGTVSDVKKMFVVWKTIEHANIPKMPVHGLESAISISSLVEKMQVSAAEVCCVAKALGWIETAGGFCEIEAGRQLRLVKYVCGMCYAGRSNGEIYASVEEHFGNAEAAFVRTDYSAGIENMRSGEGFSIFLQHGLIAALRQCADPEKKTARISDISKYWDEALMGELQLVLEKASAVIATEKNTVCLRKKISMKSLREMQ